MAYGKLLLKPNKRHIPWRRPRRLIAALASSTFWLSACESSLCRNGLLEGCHGACLSALSGWLLGRTEGPGNGAPARCLPSSPTVPLTSTSWPLCCHPAAQRALFSCLQCSQCKDLCQLACFKWCPRTDTTMVRQLSRRWALGAGGTVSAICSPRSILIPEPTRTAIGIGSSYSWLGGSLLPQHAAVCIETSYQQLH